MVYAASYETFLNACVDIVRRRERIAKPVIGDLLLSRVDREVPNDALLSHIFAESLLRRIDRNLVASKNIYLEAFDVSQIDLFYFMCQGYPQVKKGHRIANQFLAYELRSLRHATLFEIGIGKGFQVVELMSELAADPGRLERLDVVALDPDPDNLTESRARLERLLLPRGLGLHVHTINALIEHLGDDELDRIARLAAGGLVMNSAYSLHHTMHAVNDTEMRTELLRRLNLRLRPRLFTLIEPSANHDTEHLVRRFQACWEHFGTVFELVDEADIGSEHKFAIKEMFFGREIRDIFGTSDAFRCERHERYESWLFRLAKAGFTPYQAQGIEFDLQLPAYCTVDISDGLARLGYRKLPLIAVFAYKSKDEGSS